MRMSRLPPQEVILVWVFVKHFHFQLLTRYFMDNHLTHTIHTTNIDTHTHSTGTPGHACRTQWQELSLLLCRVEFKFHKRSACEEEKTNVSPRKQFLKRPAYLRYSSFLLAEEQIKIFTKLFISEAPRTYLLPVIQSDLWEARTPTPSTRSGGEGKCLAGLCLCLQLGLNGAFVLCFQPLTSYISLHWGFKLLSTWWDVKTWVPTRKTAYGSDFPSINPLMTVSLAVRSSASSRWMRTTPWHIDTHTHTNTHRQKHKCIKQLKNVRRLLVLLFIYSNHYIPLVKGSAAVQHEGWPPGGWWDDWAAPGGRRWHPLSWCLTWHCKYRQGWSFG